MVIAILVIFAATLSFSSTSRAADELVVAGSFGHSGEPEGGFDPINGWATTTEPLIQSTLFKRDNTSLVNDLATNYSVSSDGLTWTVKIRKDVKFTDGVPLTAKDVAFTFNKASNSTSGMDLSMLKSATALDNSTVQFKLNDPQSTFIYKLTGLGIIPEHAYNNETYGQQPIGSGPYKFVQWDKGQQVILERNDEYYGKKPYFKKITLLFMKSDAAFAAAKAGQVDIAQIPDSYANQTVTGMNTVSLDSIDARGISFPMVADTGKKTEDNYTLGNNVTADTAIRKALNIGIDRQELINGALNGHGAEEFTGVDRLPFGNKAAVFKDGNTTGAQEILASGGWKDIDNDGILEKNGTKAEFTLVYPSDDQTRQALAVSVSEQAQKLGIKINVEGKSWDEIDTLAYSTPVLWGYGSIDPTDMYLRYYSVRSGSGKNSKYNNVIFYNNSVVDKNLRNAMTTFNNNSNNYWKAAAWDGTTGYSEKGNATWLWMATLKYVYVVKDNLDIGTPGLQPHGSDIFNNIYDWKRTGNQTS